MPIVLGMYGSSMLVLGIFLGTLVPQEMPEYRENEALAVCNVASLRQLRVNDSIITWLNDMRNGPVLLLVPPVVVAEED